MNINVKKCSLQELSSLPPRMCIFDKLINFLFDFQHLMLIFESILVFICYVLDVCGWKDGFKTVTVFITKLENIAMSCL